MKEILSFLQLLLSIVKIAWRSVQHRTMAATLTMLSMAMGVMLIVAVLTMFGVVTDSFRSNSSLGYDLVVGAKGGKMQLTLNSVYYLSEPIETIPYEYYLEFYDSDYRADELKNSIAYHTHEARWVASDLDLLESSSAGMLGPAALLQAAVFSAIEQQDREPMRMAVDGRFENYADLAIPINLGDYFHEFRVVATQPTFFEELVVGYEQQKNPETGEYEEAEKHFETSAGRFFEQQSEENGFFECVVGSVVARKHNVRVGDYINPTHGAPDGETHENGFKVVGIIESTGTPNDRVVFVNIEGFFLMEDHAKPLDSKQGSGKRADEAAEDDDIVFDASDTAVASSVAEADMERAASQNSSAEIDADADQPTGTVYRTHLEPLPIEQREVTAILVRSSDPLGMGAYQMETPINEGILKSSLRWSPYQPSSSVKQDAAQAVAPIKEIETLLNLFVYPIQYALLFLTGMICIVSGLSILVSIYNSMSERRHEIAVMRSLGASRWMVLMIILNESIILSLFGGLAGWVAGHAFNAIASPFVEAKSGVKLGFLDFAPPNPMIDLPGEFLDTISPEWLLIPALILLAILVGLYPAITAYRTDVSKSL